MQQFKRVLLIDDHPLMMQGIRDLLSHTGDFRIVGEAATGAEGIEVARAEQPDLTILDLRIGEELAPDVCGPLQAVAPSTKIAIFTAFDDEELLRACMKRGVSGVLLKDSYGMDLVTAFRAILADSIVIDPRIETRHLARRGRATQPCSEVQEHLTDREHQVLRLLARGMTSREIAKELYLATNTVRSYTQEVLEKLGASNRVQAISTARRMHLI